MKIRMVVLLLVCLLILPELSNALTLFGVGPRGGYYKSKDADSGRLFVGAAARFKLASLGFEGAIDYRSEEYSVAGFNMKATAWPVTASILFYPLPIVYAVAGFGWYNTTLEFSSDLFSINIPSETAQETGYHFGAGAEIPFGSVTFAADIRYVFLEYQFSAASTTGTIESNFYALTISMFWGL